MRLFYYVSLGWESKLKVDERGRIKLLDNCQGVQRAADNG